MKKFEQFDVCCPKQSGDHEIWKTKLEYEQAEITNELNQYVFLLNLFNHELRFGILLNVFSRPHCICELVEKLNVGNSLVSYHLSLLEQNDLVERTKQGGYIFIKLTSKGKKYLNWIRTMPLGNISKY